MLCDPIRRPRGGDIELVPDGVRSVFICPELSLVRSFVGHLLDLRLGDQVIAHAMNDQKRTLDPAHESFERHVLPDVLDRLAQIFQPEKPLKRRLSRRWPIGEQTGVIETADGNT